MPKYQVTIVFTLDAASKAEAIASVSANLGETVDYLRVAEAQTKTKGWVGAFKEQVAGK